MKPVIGFPVAILLTCLLWAFFYSTYPIFVAREALAKSRELGVLTPELEVIIRADDFKSSLVVYAAWGLVVGVIGALVGPGKGLGVRLVLGGLVGVMLGALTNYISDTYALRSSPPMDAIQYWIKRYSLVQLPLTLAIAFSASIGSWTTFPTNLVKALLAAVLAACLYSFVMGLLTPLEQVQFNYPQFNANSLVLLLSFNLLSYAAVTLGAKPQADNSLTTTAEADSPS